jgi:hypothetical protein
LAKNENKSLNEVVIEALAGGLELDAKPAEDTDLDALIGSWQEDSCARRRLSGPLEVSRSGFVLGIG